MVPYDMELQRKESKEFLDDLTSVKEKNEVLQPACIVRKQPVTFVLD